MEQTKAERQEELSVRSPALKIFSRGRVVAYLPRLIDLKAQSSRLEAPTQATAATSRSMALWQKPRKVVGPATATNEQPLRPGELEWLMAVARARSAAQ